MIIVSLSGGLGNQMFQYALGRKMSLKNDNVFKLDKSAYTEKNPRAYKLNNFNIVENIASATEIKQLKLPYGFLSRLRKAFVSRIMRVFNVEFKPNILEKKGDIYLDGFWQSEKYFADIREIILKDFSLKNSLQKPASLILEKITSVENPISVHVRRGDYVKEPKTNAYWGTCSPEYYMKSVKFIKEKIKSPTIFVFSDDIEWVKQNIKFDDPVVFVSNPDVKDYEELYLMSKCKHHIIANSSFSWWGAWLGQNKDKIVVAPKQWQIKAVHRAKDIVPNSWIKI